MFPFLMDHLLLKQKCDGQDGFPKKVRPVARGDKVGWFGGWDDWADILGCLGKHGQAHDNANPNLLSSDRHASALPQIFSNPAMSLVYPTLLTNKDSGSPLLATRLHQVT